MLVVASIIGIVQLYSSAISALGVGVNLFWVIFDLLSLSVAIEAVRFRASSWTSAQRSSSTLWSRCAHLRPEGGTAGRRRLPDRRAHRQATTVLELTNLNRGLSTYDSADGAFDGDA